MTDREWIDNLKKGDPVICASVYQKGIAKKVDRVTPAQIIVKNGNSESRYLKRNGRRLGPWSGWLEQPQEVTK